MSAEFNGSISTSLDIIDHMSAPILQITANLNQMLYACQQVQSYSDLGFQYSGLSQAEQSAQGLASSLAHVQSEVAQAGEAIANLPTPAPIEIPVTWQSPNTVELFSDSGVERFRQELAGVNGLLDSVEGNQRSIDHLANAVDIFPASMLTDLQTLNTRIQRIQTAVAQLNRNPLDDMGANQVNSQMETLRTHLNTALDLQNDLTSAMDRMDISAANTAYTRLNSLINATDGHIRSNITAQNSFNNSLSTGTTQASKLSSQLSSMAAAYLSWQTATKVMDLSDSVANTNARLNLMVDDGGSVDDLRDKIFAVAQDTRSGFLETADAISKIGILAGDSFSSNDEVIAFMDLMNKAYNIAGATTEMRNGSMLQLTQALSAGRLQGEEFNSILENASPLASAIEDYMRNVMGATESMKELASQGLITNDVITNALFSAADELNAQFEVLPVTFSQAWTYIGNDIINDFIPVLQQIAQGAVWIHDNWSRLSPIFYTVAAAILAIVAAYGLYQLAAMAATVATSLFSTALWTSPYTWAIIAIMAIVFAYGQWRAAILNLEGTTLSSSQVIAATVATLIAGIYNGVAGLYNFIVHVVVGLWNLFLIFMGFLASCFANPLAAAAHLFLNFFNLVFDTLINIARMMDTLFGTTMASALSGFQNKVNNLVTSVAGEQAVQFDLVSASDYTLDYLDYSAAWDFGASIGAGIGSGLESDYTLDYNGFIGDLPESLAVDVPGDVGSIAGNTGSIADSLDITAEDLKYLRDLAETQAVNRFTTAEISVSFGDINNTVAKDTDLDGIVSYLASSVQEAMSKTAEGVH